MHVAGFEQFLNPAGMFEHLFGEKTAVGEDRDQVAKPGGRTRQPLEGRGLALAQTDEKLEARSGAGEPASSRSRRSSAVGGRWRDRSAISRTTRGRSWKARWSRRCTLGQLFQKHNRIAGADQTGLKH